MSDTNVSIPLHPFYPVDVKLEDYLANDRSVPLMLAAFAGLNAVVLGLTWVVCKATNPRLSTRELTLVMWFVFSSFRFP